MFCRRRRRRRRRLDDGNEVLLESWNTLLIVRATCRTTIDLSSYSLMVMLELVSFDQFLNPFHFVCN